MIQNLIENLSTLTTTQRPAIRLLSEDGVSPFQRMKRKFGVASDSDMFRTSTFPGEENQVKFWLLPDGSPIWVAHRHSDTAMQGADLAIPQLRRMGAIRVASVLDGHMFLEFDIDPTPQQTSWLIKLAKNHNTRSLILEYGEGEIPLRRPGDISKILKGEMSSPSLAAQFHENVKEATLSQLARKQKSITRLFPDFFSNPIKVRGVVSRGGVRMSGMDKDTWHFKIHSGSEEGTWYDAHVRWKNIGPDLERLVADRRNWNRAKTKIDLRKLAAKFFKTADVELECSCPADLFWGKHYIRSQDKYRAKYGEPENRPPDIRNPKKYGAYCKHLQVLMRVLPFYKSTMANWLKREYKGVIARAERKARREAGKYKAAAKALAKRRTKESIMQEAVLPSVQRKMKDKALPFEEEMLWRFSIYAEEEDGAKFWVLNDGTLVHVPSYHKLMLPTDKDGRSISMERFSKTGAIRVFSIPEDIIYISFEKNPTKKQMDSLMYIARKHKVRNISFGSEFGDLRGELLKLGSYKDIPNILRGQEVSEPSLAARFHESLEESNLPKLQIKLKRFALSRGDVSRKLPSSPFFLLSDGSFVDVHLETHIRYLENVDIKLSDFFRSGGIRGSGNWSEGQLFLEFHAVKHTEYQIQAIEKIISSLKSLWIDVYVPKKGMWYFELHSFDVDLISALEDILEGRVSKYRRYDIGSKSAQNKESFEKETVEDSLEDCSEYQISVLDEEATALPSPKQLDARIRAAKWVWYWSKEDPEQPTEVFPSCYYGTKGKIKSEEYDWNLTHRFQMGEEEHKAVEDYVFEDQPPVGFIGETLENMIQDSEGAIRDVAMFRGVVWSQDDMNQLQDGWNQGKPISITFSRPTSWTNEHKVAWKFAGPRGYRQTRRRAPQGDVGVILKVLVLKGTKGVNLKMASGVGEEIVLSKSIEIQVVKLEMYRGCPRVVGVLF